MTDMDSDLSGGAKPNEGDKPNSSDSTETEVPQWAVEMQKQMEETTNQVRALQSGKDKGINNLQKQLDEQSASFAEIFELGKKYDNPAEAERDWFIDQQIKAAKQGNQYNPFDVSAPQNQDMATQNSEAGTVDPELLKQYGVDPQSPEYLEQVRQGKVGLEAALAVVTARQTQNLDGGATGASGGSGGSSASNATAQQVLRDEYNAALDEAQKQNGGVLPALKLYQIQEEYQKKGLDLW